MNEIISNIQQLADKTLDHRKKVFLYTAVSLDLIGCNVCNNVDDLIHFFIYCENTKQFWTIFYKWWNNISEFNIGRNDLFFKCTLFGYPGEEDIIQILNYCALLAKYLYILIN